jgi:hypothetical protein
LTEEEEGERKKEKYLTGVAITTISLGFPVCIPSLYRLSYPVSSVTISALLFMSLKIKFKGIYSGINQTIAELPNGIIVLS